MNRFLLGVAVFSGTLAAQAASAATQTATIGVSATVSTVCTMSATPLAFGEVAATGATPGTASITVNCTGGGAYTVGLDTGLNNVAAQRNLKSGTHLLAYGLFQDAAFGTVWTNAGAGLVSGVGNGLPQVLTVYGQVTTGQVLVSGNGTPYTDTVQVTLTY
jgi:spore coat protein U-like protein